MEFRRATINDAQILLEWRNDIETRENSIESQVIEWAHHLKWLRDSLENKNREIYIAHHNHTPVGMLRFDYIKDKDGWQLSWLVAPEMRGKGHGKALLSEGVNLKHGRKFSQIKETNLASIKMAVSVGFKLEQSQSGVQTYVLASS